MALKTFVKISGVSNLSDARYCAGMGVDQLGFNLNPLEAEAVSPELFMEIKDWVSGVKLVGEFDLMKYEDLALTQQQLPLDLIEISSLDDVEKVNLLGKPVSFKYDISHEVHLKDLPGVLTYLDELVEQIVLVSVPEFYEALNREVNFYNGNLKLIKGYDVHAHNALNTGNFAGIQLKGTREDQPGFKDYGVIMDVLEVLEADD
jgi:phosphoribosylanthranilate isomerase